MDVIPLVFSIASHHIGLGREFFLIVFFFWDADGSQRNFNEFLFLSLFWETVSYRETSYQAQLCAVGSIS